MTKCLGHEAGHADRHGVRGLCRRRAGRGGLRTADFAPHQSPLLGWHQSAGLRCLAAGVPSDHGTCHRHPRWGVHRARRDPDRGHRTDHALCDSVQGHALLYPSASPARRYDSCGDGNPRKQGWFLLPGRPLSSCRISHSRRTRRALRAPVPHPHSDAVAARPGREPRRPGRPHPATDGDRRRVPLRKRCQAEQEPA